jgi:hypothetical protein
MIRINWTSAYQGQTDYRVSEPGRTPYRIRLRHMIPECEGGHWNYTREEFEKEVAGALGIVANNYSREPISPEVFEAFKAQYSGAIPVEQLSRGYYEPARGWIRVSDEPAQQAA